MYPVPVVVVGCGEQLLPHVRRELCNLGATIEAEFPSTPVAVERLRPSRNEMRVFVCHASTTQDVEQLKQLGGAFSGRPVVALVSEKKELGELFAANRAGAAQLVPLPLRPTDFAAAMNCLRVQFGYGTAESRVIAVTGATGGCGATTLAINLAHEIAFQHKLNTILTELALQMGMLATCLDVEPKLTTYDLLSSSTRMDVYMVQQALLRIADNLDIIPGPHRAIAPLAVSAREVIQLIDYARTLARMVVLDVPCNFNDLFFEILCHADQVVLVGEQKVPSIRALKLVRETLGPERADRQQVVINRYDPRIEGFSLTDLDRLLGAGKLLRVSADVVGVTGAVNHGRVLRLEAPYSPALADISELARSLLGLVSTAHPPTNGPGLFGRLVRAFSNK
jgi:pilus assembly protein CpaE